MSDKTTLPTPRRREIAFGPRVGLLNKETADERELIGPQNSGTLHGYPFHLGNVSLDLTEIIGAVSLDPNTCAARAIG
jgi:hypothetical protein